MRFKDQREWYKEMQRTYGIRHPRSRPEDNIGRMQDDETRRVVERQTTDYKLNDLRRQINGEGRSSTERE